MGRLGNVKLNSCVMNIMNDGRAQEQYTIGTLFNCVSTQFSVSAIFNVLRPVWEWLRKR